MYFSYIANHFLVGGWSSLLIPLAIVAVLLVVFAIPLAKQRSNFLRITREIGSDYDRHWLWGHSRKYAINTYEGLCNCIKRCEVLPAMSANWLGPFHLGISLYHPEVIKTLLTKQMPKTGFYQKFLGPLFRDGLVTSSGSLWKRHRRLLAPIFHFNVLKSHVVIFNKNCSKAVLSFERAAASKSVHDVNVDIAHISYRNMMECVMSQTADLGSEEDNMYISSIKEASMLIFERWGTPHLWPDFIFNRLKRGKKLQSIVGLIHRKVDRIIRERRAVLELLRDDAESVETDGQADGNQSFSFRKRKGQPIDFLDILIQTKDQDGVGLTNDEISDEVTTFFSAGQGTVANAVCWLLHYLAKNLEIQQECRDEINEVIENRPEVSWNDLSNLPYLTQCIKESLRMMPPLHIIARQLPEDVTFSHQFNDNKEIVVKKGIYVAINTYALHRNPHLWKDPEVFNPDRFNPENSARRTPFTYIPFAAGSRNCIGQHFAMHQIRVIVCQMLRRFEFYKDGETAEPLPAAGVGLFSLNGLKLKIRQV